MLSGGCCLVWWCWQFWWQGEEADQGAELVRRGAARWLFNYPRIIILSLSYHYLILSLAARWLIITLLSLSYHCLILSLAARYLIINVLSWILIFSVLSWFLIKSHLIEMLIMRILTIMLGGWSSLHHHYQFQYFNYQIIIVWSHSSYSYLIKSLYHTLMIKSHIILEKSSTQTKRKTNWLVKQFDYPKISLVIIRYSEPLRRSLYLIIWKLFLYHLESNVMMITAGIIAAKILKIIIIAI